MWIFGSAMLCNKTNRIFRDKSPLCRGYIKAGCCLPGCHSTPPLVPSPSLDVVLERDSELMTHSQIKPANFNGTIIDTECIIGQNNSDITTCTQESETNMISAFSLVRNDSCYNTVKCPENVPEAQNSSNIHGSLSDSNMHVSLSESTINRCASCNHIPQNLSLRSGLRERGYILCI